MPDVQRLRGPELDGCDERRNGKPSGRAWRAGGAEPAGGQVMWVLTRSLEREPVPLVRLGEESA